LKLARDLNKVLCAGETIAAAAQNKTTMQTIAGKLSFSKLPLSRLGGGTKVNNL
jgi:hypothetical protein